MSKRIYIRSNSEGYAHPKCYLSHTNGCDTKITGEHCISHVLLNKIERQNKSIDVLGLSWLPKDYLTSIGKKSLVSNVLCSSHNANLSPLDNSIGELVEAISQIDAEYLKPDPAGCQFKIDGSCIERWILKTLLGLAHSGQIKQRSGELFKIKPECVNLLCVPHARWPHGWGLYFATPSTKIHHSLSFELIPKSHPETGELLALGLKFNGIEMHFLMTTPDQPQSFGVLRPAVLRFRKGSVVSTIRFSWPRRKAGSAIVLTHQGTYTGASPDHSFLKQEHDA